MVPVTQQQLAAALDGMELYVVPEGGNPRAHHGAVGDPEAVAEELFAILSAAWQETVSGPAVVLPEPRGDAEIRAMQAIVDALAPFERALPGPIERILRWACDRWYVTLS